MKIKVIYKNILYTKLITSCDIFFLIKYKKKKKKKKKKKPFVFFYKQIK